MKPVVAGLVLFCLIATIYPIDAKNLASFPMHRTDPPANPVPFTHLYKKYRAVEEQVYGQASSHITKAIAGAEGHLKTLGAQGKTTNLPLGGNVYPIGIFYINVGVGSNNRQFPVALDSGSCTLLVPGKGCQGCTTKVMYDPASSTTAQSIPCPSFDYDCYQCTNGGQCSFYNQYQTCNLTDPNAVCTVSGPVYQDQFNLNGLKGSNVFGTITYQTANFQQFYVIDGVMGFACDSQWNQPTALQYLVNSHQIDNSFSLCLDQSGQGGVFTLGGADPSLYTGSFQYTNFIQGVDGLYYIWMDDFQVAGQSIGVDANSLNSGGTVVDTGTNVLLMPDTPFQALRATMQGMCSSVNLPGFCDQKNQSATLFDGMCFPLTPSQRQMWPDLTLVFDPSTPAVMKSNNYIIENNPGSGQYCLGITNTGVGGMSIIGDTTMQPYVTLFDRANQRLGFAPVNAANCKYKPSE